MKIYIGANNSATFEGREKDLKNGSTCFFISNQSLQMAALKKVKINNTKEKFERKSNSAKLSLKMKIAKLVVI